MSTDTDTNIVNVLKATGTHEKISFVCLDKGIQQGLLEVVLQATFKDTMRSLFTAPIVCSVAITHWWRDWITLCQKKIA